MTSSEREELRRLIDRAKAISMSDEEQAAQRRSFAYGNASFENPMITKEMIKEEEAKLESGHG